jgi:hypothetical protein
MINYSYKIRQLSTQTVDGIDNVVTHIHFDYVGENENGQKAYCQAVIPFNVKQVVKKDPVTNKILTQEPDFNPNGYTPFNELTQEQVNNWIDSNLDPAMVPTFKEIITEKLNKLAQNNASYLPWNNGS